MVAAFTPDMGIVGCRSFVGHSMEPTFYSESLVCITEDPGYLQTVGIGDIVIAHCIDYGLHLSVIHRIVNTVDGKWQLKGDNNAVPDPCLKEKTPQQDGTGIDWVVVGLVR